VSVTATAGTLGVTGTIDAGTLAVIAAPTISVAGSVIGPTSSLTASTGTIGVSGLVNASTLAVLTAPTISISGSVIAPTSSLTASTGTLGITGVVDAATMAILSGNAGIIGPTGTILGNGALNAISTTGSVDLTGTSNAIASVEGSAPGFFRVTDSVGLSILAGKSVVADTIRLTALGLTNAGTVTASGAGTVGQPALQLTATGGTIANSGLVQATDTVAGDASLSATAGITAAGTIVAAGPGSAGSPSLKLHTSGGSISQTTGLIAATNANGFLSLHAAGGAIDFAGTLASGGTSTPTGTIDLMAATDITETVTGGATAGLMAALLTGSAGGDIALNTTTAFGNRIFNLGSMSAGGSLAIMNARDLAVVGPVTASGGPLNLVVTAGGGTSGNLVNTSTITANNVNTGAIRLAVDASIDNASGATIVAAGAGSSGTASVALVASGGTIGNAAGGTIQASNTTSGNVSLTAPGGISSGGRISAAGSVAGGHGISLTTAGVFTQTGGVITTTHANGSALMNAGSIDIAGTVDLGSAGVLTLISAGRITEGGGTSVGSGVGTIIAGGLMGSSTTTTTLDNIANQIGTIGPFSAADNLTLRNSAATLNTTGAVTVSGANGVLVLQNGVTGGDNGMTLAAGSTLTATNVTLLAPGIADGRSARIVATSLTLPNAGTPQVGTGTGVTSARQLILGDPTSTNPTPINAIGTIGAVVATESLVVMDATALLLAGDIFAPTIRVGATDGLTVANNVTVTTGGQTIPLPGQSSAPPDKASNFGFNLAILGGAGTIDLGPNLTILPTAGVGEPMMRLALPANGTIRFGNVNAQTTNVLLHAGKGTATSAGGTNIQVGKLFVFYETAPPASGTWSGTVGGQDATGAATISRIGRESTTIAFPNADVSNASFEPSPAFQINQCAISSVNCVLTSILQVPPQLPLQTLYLPLPTTVLDDPDLLLPFISDQDE
jgi:hypothetical protein